MVDAVVSVFLEKLLNIIEKESRFFLGVEDQLKKLKDELLYVQSFLKDGERIKRKNDVLRRALVDLRELVYESEDMFAGWEALMNGTSGGFWIPSKAPSTYSIGKQLEKVKEKIAAIKDRISNYVTPLPSADDIKWRSPQIYDHTQVVGLDSDTKKVKDWLSQADRGILAIGIVGMGGLGKSTLAQKVFNDKQVELLFEKRIWVLVSQSLDEKRILTNILRTLGDVSPGDDCGELLKRINQYLSGKRFLMVLDDVWTKGPSWWGRVYDGLPKENKSCVIVTTRNEEVAKKMKVRVDRVHRPKFLSKKDSWLLFCNVAFAWNNDKLFDELEKIGKEIASKCGGLPLAIKAVGGIIGSKERNHREWERILKNFKDELEEEEEDNNDNNINNKVMASLQLSYDELPPELKSCFLSLSIYPEDSVIGKDQLVRWWIGEGFVTTGKKNGRLSSEASEDCFTRLTNRCLVEVVDWDYNGKIETCKVHDMVRDLVIKIAGEDAFNERHLGINNDTEQKNGILPNKKLRALTSTSRSGEVNKIAWKSFGDFPHLRMLDLSKSIFEVPIGTLLGNVGDFKLLGCLNLSNTHPLTRLPSSLEKADKIQVLDFSYCQSLKCLPPFVTKFLNLSVLDVSHCGSLEFLPKGLGILKNLQVLLGFKPARIANGEGSRISDLRNLLHLRILELQLTRADEIDDTDTQTLTELEELDILTIDCYHSFENELLVSKLEKLLPPKKLHELSLKFYPGKTSPRWLNAKSLVMLRYLALSGGNLVTLSGNFWESAWRIEGLKLDSLSHLSMQWENVQHAMPYLRTVHSFWCPELKGFPIDGVGFRGGVWKKEDRHTQATDTQGDDVHA